MTICRLIIRGDPFSLPLLLLPRVVAVVNVVVVTVVVAVVSATVAVVAAVVVISHTHFKSQLSAHNAHR